MPGPKGGPSALGLLLLPCAKLIFQYVDLSKSFNVWNFWLTAVTLLCARDFSCDFTKEEKRSLRPRYTHAPPLHLIP